jgi:hypothetical protein
MAGPALRTAIPVPEQAALTAPAPPVPTASTKQEHNHDNNQNRFYTHFEVLRRANGQRLRRSGPNAGLAAVRASLLGVAPDLWDLRSLKSLTGQGLSSLFKIEHT